MLTSWQAVAFPREETCWEEEGGGILERQQEGEGGKDAQVGLPAGSSLDTCHVTYLPECKQLQLWFPAAAEPPHFGRCGQPTTVCQFYSALWRRLNMPVWAPDMCIIPSTGQPSLRGKTSTAWEVRQFFSTSLLLPSLIRRREGTGRHFGRRKAMGGQGDFDIWNRTWRLCWSHIWLNGQTPFIPIWFLPVQPCTNGCVLFLYALLLSPLTYIFSHLPSSFVTVCCIHYHYSILMYYF